MTDGFKYDVAAGVAGGIKTRLEESARATKDDVLRAQGGIQMCALAAQRVEQLSQQVDREQDEMGADTYQAVKRWLARAQGVMISLQNQCEVKMHTLTGKALGLEQAASQAASEEDRQVAQKQAALSANEDGESDPARAHLDARARVPGQRPGNPLEDRRSEPEPEPELEPEPEPEPEPESKPPVDSSRPRGDHTSSVASLMRKTKPELQKMAKRAGVSSSGTKRKIIDRILDADT